jgi:hypothetical protein
MGPLFAKIFYGNKKKIFFSLFFAKKSSHQFDLGSESDLQSAQQKAARK